MDEMTLCSSIIYYYYRVLHIYFVQVQRSRRSPRRCFFFYYLLLLSCPTFLVLPARHSPFLKVGTLHPPTIYTLTIPTTTTTTTSVAIYRYRPSRKSLASLVPSPGINFWDWHRPAPIRPGTRESLRHRPPLHKYIYMNIIYIYNIIVPDR